MHITVAAAAKPDTLLIWLPQHTHISNYIWLRAEFQDRNHKPNWISDRCLRDLVDAFFNPNAYFKSNGTDPILRGLLVENARVIDEFISSILTSKLFADGPTRIGADLASLNIQRGRDHGLAPYCKWERLCKVLFPGMNTSFYYKNTVQKLKDLYRPDGFRNGIDLWVGGLAEQKISGGQVGPTFACIMGLVSRSRPTPPLSAEGLDNCKYQTQFRLPPDSGGCWLT